MMASAVLRKKLHGFIDLMSERDMSALEPVLERFTEPLYTIEPASPEECAMVEERMKDYPSGFVSWKDVKKKLKAKKGDVYE